MDGVPAIVHNVEERWGGVLNVPRCDSGRTGSKAGLIGLEPSHGKAAFAAPNFGSLAHLISLLLAHKIPSPL